MKLKKTAAKATLAGALGAAAVGLGAGLAQADPPFPVPPPWPVPAPADPGVSVEGPSVSAPGVEPRGSGCQHRPAGLGSAATPVAAVGAVAAGLVECGGAGLGRLHECRLPAGLSSRMGRSPRHCAGRPFYVWGNGAKRLLKPDCRSAIWASRPS